MTKARNKVLYAVWLKEKGRKSGEMVLDCFHVAADSERTEREIREYVKKRISECPSSFSIGNVSIENIDLTDIIRIANIENGEILGSELME